MNSQPETLTLTITSDAHADDTLYLPATNFNEPDPVADRVLVKNSANNRRTVLRTSMRAAGTTIGVSPRTFHGLGGKGQGELSCAVSPARWWHILRYVSGAALACAVAVLSAASAAFSAWFGLHDGLAQIKGDKVAFVVIAVAFVTNALLALLNLQQDLTSI
jgi:hypothetical protein